MIQQEEQTPLMGLVYWVGFALVAVGALSLIYIAILVVGLVQSPMESELIAWVSAAFAENDTLLSGYISETQFEIHANEKLQFMLLGLVGLIAISIMTRVLHGLLTSGVSLIRLSRIDLKKTRPGVQ
jgi:hypothetical protein